MYLLVAHYDNLSQDEIGGNFVPHPTEEVVARFTSKRKAEAYLSKAMLKVPKWVSYSGAYPFRERSLLHGANSAEIRKEVEEEVPVNPEL